MSYDENGNTGNVIIRNLFWGFYIAKPWFKRKVKYQQNTYQSPTGILDHNAFFKSFGSMVYIFKISFAITFLLVSIPIGIIRLIFALILMKKRTDTSNANSIENKQ
jgi:hypothetical protein